jgi:hypothetical protein
MGDVISALVGAGVAVVVSGIRSLMRKDSEVSAVVIRLTAAVEHIAGEVSMLRQEIKEDRQELYPRLNGIEQRLTRLEATR